MKHLRAEAAGRGGEAGVSARERLGQAQADLAKAKAASLSRRVRSRRNGPPPAVQLGRAFSLSPIGCAIYLPGSM